MVMKKIAFAVVLCASASFSPALAQFAPPTTTGTFSRITGMVTYSAIVTVNVSGKMQTVQAGGVTLNGAYLLGPNGLEPDAATRLSGATCRISGNPASASVSCTK
jgi:hypothetical protein